MSKKKHELRHTPISHSSSINSEVFDKASEWSDSLTPYSIGEDSSASTEENTISRIPILLIGLISGLLFFVLFLQLLHLQIAEGERMRGIAEGNRVREQVTYAPRGKILDRNGVVLADNTASFQLSATPYLLPGNTAERERMYKKVANTVENLSTQEIKKEVSQEGMDSPQPVLLAEGLPRETALEVEYILPDLKGFDLNSVPIRDYKSDSGLSHILGYVGRVSKKDLEENPGIYPIDFIGKLGVEAEYDEVLRGQNGVVETEVDALGRPLRTLRERPTEPGQDINLTIDYELQKQLADSLRKQMNDADVNSGSGVILDPDTGDILAMVSLPSYDNNKFAKGIEPEEYQELINHPKQPMFNRAAAGGFPSGSVIKPVALIGALDTNTVTEDTIINDTGSLVVRSQYDPSATFTFMGWDPSGLGPMDARRAIAMSSNIYFYTVAGGSESFDGMGIDNLVKYYKKFGLGSRTGIDLPEETEGRVPTPEWKKSQTGEEWYVGDTYNLGIGQGDLLVSPLQMARAHAAIANNGKLFRPNLMDGNEPEITSKLNIKDHYFQVVQEGMRQTVTRGTTSPVTFADVGAPVAGKSGTAETDPNGTRDPHAWYSAYAPYDDPEVLGVVLLEEGEGGSQYAAPVLAEVFKQYFR